MFVLKEKKQMQLTFFYYSLYIIIRIVDPLAADEIYNWDLAIIKKYF